MPRAGLALTPRVAALAALGLLPALATIVSPGALWWLAAWNVGLVAAVVVDLVLAPTAGEVTLRLQAPERPQAGVAQPLELELLATSTRARRLVGTLRLELARDHHLEPARLEPALEHGGYRTTVTLTPGRRGPLHFGRGWLRARGPLGLAARQWAVGEPKEHLVRPPLENAAALPLSARHARLEHAHRLVPRAHEGRELESLREHRDGDDPRHLDWKASARRGRWLTRTFRPERHQPVLALLDLGRSMAGSVEGRPRSDLAIEATLRLGRACAEVGDLFGVLAYAATVRLHLPVRPAKETLAALPERLAPLEARLEESDVGAAFEAAFRRHRRRSLVVVITELLDRPGALALLAHTHRLTPRHLPVIIALEDPEVTRTARAAPATPLEAHARDAAQRLLDARRRLAAELSRAGASVISAAPGALASATTAAYLEAKTRGRL